MLRRIPLRIAAPLFIALPVLVVGVGLSALWAIQSRAAVTSLADQNIEQIHDQVSSHVNALLSTPIRLCRVNAHLVEIGALDTGDLASWLPTLTNQARAFDMLSSVAWGAADGRSTWISRYADGFYYFALKDDPARPTMREWRVGADGSVPSTPTNTFDFNLFSRPWFTAPRDADAATWSPPYVWVGGADTETTLGISYGIPLHNPDGSLRGIIDADLSLNDLSHFLASLEIGKTGIGAIVASDGKLIAASNDSPIFTPEAERMAAGQSPDPLIAAAARSIEDEGGDAGEHGEIVVDGATYFLRASPIGRDVGLAWTLATIIPERDFTAEIDAGLRRSSIMSIIAILAAVGIGIGASFVLVRPILAVVNYARRIGQGDLDTHVTLNQAPEYVHLADELNAMTTGLRDRLRMRKSLSMAMEVQQSLLPSGSPTVEGLDIAGHSTYCDETGGDYYDFLDVGGLNEQTIAIALGDVMGHGIAAAMMMASARGILRSRCQEPGSLADLLDHLNAMLCHDAESGRFMTMLLMTINAKAHEVRWASAGHGTPIVYDTEDDLFLTLEGTDLPLGIEESEKYQEHKYTQVRAGQVYLAATDGLWETKNEANELYGMDRVHELIRRHAHLPSAEISEAIRDALVRYRGPLAQDDDLTFVVVKVL